MSDAEYMKEAADRSLTEDVCMFCGESFEPDELHDAEDWDGNKGRACNTCDEE